MWHRGTCGLLEVLVIACSQSMQALRGPRPIHQALASCLCFLCDCSKERL